MVSTTSAIVIGAVALLLVGPRKLPELARGLGKAMGEFRKGVQGMDDPEGRANPPAEPPADSAPKA
ncbi:MAG: twin-arginine translocase TatA/TatE family subunit [Candidatus Sericytochromatia bacterium]|nr:twin-arginine translocase TatA/TatE family subunit [Candidatus Tanganyikabacteria bacterium]